MGFYWIETKNRLKTKNQKNQKPKKPKTKNWFFKILKTKNWFFKPISIKIYLYIFLLSYCVKHCVLLYYHFLYFVLPKPKNQKYNPKTNQKPIKNQFWFL